MNTGNTTPSPPALATDPHQRTVQLLIQTFGRLLALLLVFGLFWVLIYFHKGQNFASPLNLENMLVQSTVYAMCAIGATLVIITAGIDLSAGSVIALGVIVTAAMLHLADDELFNASPALWPIVCVATAVGVCALAGLANGALVTGLRIVPFVVTLGTLQLIRGLSKGIGGQTNIYAPDSWVNSLMDPVIGTERWWLLLPPGVMLTLVAAVLVGLMLRYTRFGRHIFAVGSNEHTARLCGVRVVRTKVLVYMLAGLFAGLAGVLQYAYLGMGDPTTASGYELYVIAAVVIGGGSLMGGEGSMLGTITGALFIGVLYAGCQKMGWDRWVQEMIIGGIIIAAVALDQFRHRRSGA